MDARQVDPIKPTWQRWLYKQRQKCQLLVSWLLLFSVPFPLGAAEDAQPLTENSDVRIIVDISGSMKQNDPNNLRIPAVKLLIKLLPEGSQAGIWTYGQWVNMLVPLSKVNTQWKENAIASIEGIRSVGLRTNIGEALEKATWKLGNDTGYKQSVILLTDGIVDIAPDTDARQTDKNQAERNRILSQIALQYQKLGTTIHTIALSPSSDIEMMRELAARTGGTHFVANKADDLLRVFAKAYQGAVPTEQVPLKKNRFSIDAGIREFTALIFRAPGSKPTELINPGGDRLTEIHQNESLKWYSERNFDLITVSNPHEGEWEIDGELDPDNRILVVSDLMLNVRNVPENIAPGDKIDLEAFLHEDGKILTHQAFLKLMSVELRVTQEGGRSGAKLISNPDAPPEDGIYREGLYRLSKEGTYELQVTVDGKTFQRQKTEYVTLRDPLQIEVEADMVGTPEEIYRVKITPYSSNIDTLATKVIAKVSGPESYSIIQAARKNEEGQWQVVVKPVRGVGDYEVALNVRGKNIDATDFQLKPEPIPLSFPVPADFRPYIVGKPPVEEVREEVAEETVEEPKVESIDEPESTAPDIESIEGEPEEPGAVEGTEEAGGTTESEEITNEGDQEATGEENDTGEAAVDQTETEANETTEEAVEEEQATEESSYLWLYILFGLLMLGAAGGGYFLYRWMLNKEKSSDKSSDSDDLDSDIDDLDDDLDDDEDLGGEVDGGDDEPIVASEGSDADEPKKSPDASTDEEEKEPEEEFDEDFDLSTTDDDETITLNNEAPVRPEEGRPREEEAEEQPPIPTESISEPESPAPEPRVEEAVDSEVAASETAPTAPVPDDDFDISPEQEETKSEPPEEPEPPKEPEPPLESTDEDEMPVDMDEGVEDLPEAEDIDDVDVNELMEELDQELGDQAIDDLDDVDIESLVERSGDVTDDELDDIDVEELMREMEREEDEDDKKST